MFGKKKNEDSMENELPETENINNDGEAGEEIAADNSADTLTGNDELEKERQKSNELQDKYVRLYSEFENFRRRTNKEKSDLIQYGNKDLILNILPVFDDLERANELGSKATDKEAVIHGLELIYNKFKQLLEKAGLKELSSKGEEFDSDLHDAITTIQAPSEDMKGKVIDEIQKGYKLNDKVIRHAKVVVGE